ncbi:MAG: hypothetical protein RR543_01405 [Erysipelotrichales bacterium]
MPSANEKPEYGTYKCIMCDFTVVINEENDTLPVCPTCSFTEFTKID